MAIDSASLSFFSYSFNKIPWVDFVTMLYHVIYIILKSLHHIDPRLFKHHKNGLVSCRRSTLLNNSHILFNKISHFVNEEKKALLNHLMRGLLLNPLGNIYICLENSGSLVSLEAFHRTSFNVCPPKHQI